MAKATTKKTTKTTKPKKAIAPKPVKAATAKAVKAAKAPTSNRPISKKALAAKKPVIAKKATSVRALVVSKDELRTQIEKLHSTVATLRTKNREANKALKTADAKIAELEHQISQIEVKPVAEKPVLPRKTRTRKAEATPVPEEETVEVVEVVGFTDEPADGDVI